MWYKKLVKEYKRHQTHLKLKAKLGEARKTVVDDSGGEIRYNLAPKTYESINKKASKIAFKTYINAKGMVKRRSKPTIKEDKETSSCLFLRDDDVPQ